MRRTAHKHSQDDGQQLLFSDRPTLADRTATGELIDMSQSAQASGFRWPLAVSATLHHDVQTIPRGCGRTEIVPQRWKHVFLLAATAAAQLQRDGQAEHRMNVVLRTSAAPERDREHIKHLCLTLERDPDGHPSFALGYCVA